MRTTELAWAAGFFEGEGYVSREGRLRVSVGQRETSTLERFRQAIGIGKIYGPYGVGQYSWVVTGPIAVEACRLLLSFVRGPKRILLEKGVQWQG